MHPPDTGLSAALLVAGLIGFVAGMIILQTRRNAPGAIPLMVLMFALCWWDITYSLFWAQTPAPHPNFWLYITYVGVVAIPAALLVFAMQVSRMDEWLKPAFLAGLCIEPALVLALLFTDPRHGLFFAGHQTEGIGVILNGGPVYWANLVYSYALILVAMIILVRRFIQADGIYRRQLGVILLGSGVPWVNSIIFIAGLNPVPNVDNTPFSFTIAGVAFTYALLRYRLLDIVPIARHVLVENMSDGVVVLDTLGRVVDINPAAMRSLGLTDRSCIGEPAARIFSGWEHVTRRFSSVNDIRTEVPIGDPPRSFLDLRITSLLDRRGHSIGRIVVWRDITPLKQAQMELQEQALRDPLTGLYNRRYLHETMTRELARARRENYPVSLVMIDIDHFKNLNDTFGHHTGDSILQGFAAQLLNQTRAEDTVYRYGGEEFLILLPNISAKNAYEVAERWRRSFEESNQMREIGRLDLTVSCGVSEFPANGDTAETLIEAADRALYQAKALGRNRVHIWHEGPGDRKKA